MEPVQEIDEIRDWQVLAIRLRIFPDAAFRAFIAAPARDHVNELVSFYTVETSDGCLVPPVNTPLD
jgi:hypothetical protein